MVRVLTWLLFVASCVTAAPDVTPPPPPRGHAAHVTLAGSDIAGIWRDEDLQAVLDHETAAGFLDHIQAASEDHGLEELDLDPHFTGHAEGITAPPLIADDLPLQ